MRASGVGRVVGGKEEVAASASREKIERGKI
jgi:hypothetical protein